MTTIPETNENVNKNAAAVSDLNTQVPPPTEEDFFPSGSLPGGKYSKWNKSGINEDKSGPSTLFVVAKPALPVDTTSEEPDGPVESPFSETDYRTISKVCRQEYVLCDDALCGLPGRIVQKLAPETESHPAAILLDVLVTFGSIIGRTAHFVVEDTPHYGNLFAVVVGETAKARKGTAHGRIEHIFSEVDREWFGRRRASGLSTGEGLIQEVRDERTDMKGTVVDKGVQDKRLLVYEGEFAKPLVAMQRQGNSLEVISRQAWDGKELRSLVKESPLMATGAHISIFGNITIDELEIVMSQSSLFNGFVNRFLWALARRTKKKAFGGNTLDWTSEVEELKQAIAFAELHKRVFMNRNARELWSRVYDRLSEGESGRFGAAIARAEAQVRRLALLYAMLDQSEDIRVEHLRAALALWWYCEESARVIFGGLTPLQKRLIEILLRGPRTATQIQREGLNRNVPMAKVLASLAELSHRDLVKLEKDNSGVEKYTLTATGAGVRLS